MPDPFSRAALVPASRTASRTGSGAPGLTVMTGATGFLGSHVLARLLHGPGHIVALVRDSGTRTRQRLDAALRATGHPLPAGHHHRLHLERVVLGEPMLGIPPARYRELANRVAVIWHCAGMIDLLGEPGPLHRVNVDGTRSVLALAGAARRPPRVIHMSTAFVAGARSYGVVLEDELDDRHGFLTPYERSKYHAERAVREWAHRSRRPALVLRPGVLVTDRALPGGVPRHPHAVVGARLRALGRHGPGVLIPGASPDEPVPVRFPGHPDAVNNIVQVEYAADVMTRLAARPPDRLVETFHLTHPRDTPVRHVLDAMRRCIPWLRVSLDPARTALGPVETLLARQGYAGVDRYTGLHRGYDRSRLHAALGGAPEPPAITPEYLHATFGVPEPSAAAV